MKRPVTMETRTESYREDQIAEAINAYEEAGWLVKFIVPMSMSILVTYERERAE